MADRDTDVRVADRAHSSPAESPPADAPPADAPPADAPPVPGAPGAPGADANNGNGSDNGLSTRTDKQLLELYRAGGYLGDGDCARLQQLVATRAIKIGPPTPSRAQLRQWKQRLRGVDDRITMVVDDVHITYRVYEDKRPRARDVFARGRRARAFREIKAVRGVSIEARAGEAIGLIGRNGSGKSTLLAAMAGLLPVESGRILARSQPSLLGVGAVLQPSLSGRRNIILGTLALGMSKREAEQKVDEITAFAGLEEFIDLPMRTYSSGMKARLHFSIATSVVPEILMIDEALAVGDEVFRRRSDARIRELQEAAGTIFIVSHSMESVLDTCTRVVWLDKGIIVDQGDPGTVVERYRAQMAKEVGPEGRKRRKGAQRGQR